MRDYGNLGLLSQRWPSFPPTLSWSESRLAQRACWGRLLLWVTLAGLLELPGNAGEGARGLLMSFSLCVPFMLPDTPEARLQLGDRTPINRACYPARS